MSYIRGLRQQKAAIAAEANAILQPAQAENRALSAEEISKLDGLSTQAEALAASIERAEKFEGDARAVDPPQHLAPENDPRGKFKSLGEQFQAIAVAARSNGLKVDPRLGMINAAASGLSEGVPSDGGFLIQPEYAADLLQKTYAQGALLSRVRKIPITTSNQMRINAIDETSRAAGSRWGGVLMYWADEAATVTASRPKMRQIELNLKKLIGIAYATDELLRDAAALEAIISAAFASEATFALEDAIVNGTGVGKPLGILNSPSVVQQAIEPTQTIANSNSFLALNVSKMWSRMWTGSLNQSVWLMNQELIPYLVTATVGSGAWPVYLPPGPGGSDPGIAYAPQGTLLGRPILILEQCQKVGTPGDLILSDLSQYLFGDPTMGLQTASSIHVRFLYDEMTFRFVYRADGLPAWNAAITPASGSALKQSPFITLGTRS